MNSPLAYGLTWVLAAVAGIAMWQEPAGTGGGVVPAAREFLQSLPPELQQQATGKLDDSSRTEWNFVPQQYPGVAFGALDERQSKLARALLQSVLSASGLRKVDAIVALEAVLRELEQAQGRDAAHRDGKRYWLQLFGEPSPQSAWAFRLQGHHVSLHFAIVGNRLLAATPMFLGSNPHEVPAGPHRGERVLGREEDLARGLLALLDDDQRKRATLPGEVPADVILGPRRKADGLGAPQGLAFAAMTPLQQQLLWRLIREFVDNWKGEFATAELLRIEQAGREAICFAWAGGTGRGQGNYFRVHGPTFVIEYDNTQNDANHVHTVVRDLEHDFGGDLLRAHYEHGHPHGK